MMSFGKGSFLLINCKILDKSHNKFNYWLLYKYYGSNKYLIFKKNLLIRNLIVSLLIWKND
jgi:hypothetical protein